MSIDEHLRKIQSLGYRLTILQQCGDGLWQASLRRGNREFMPARAEAAGAALVAALAQAESQRPAEVRNEKGKLRVALTSTEPGNQLCDDEGCEQGGSPHVCIRDTVEANDFLDC